MPIELRVQTGARAGYRQSFDAPVIALGRHPQSDLQFDVNRDLDVSTRHAEILFGEDGYRIRDNASTNGTFVNGRRVAGEEPLRAGDVIALGAEGPKLEVHIVSAEAAAAGVAGTVVRASKARVSTGERVKIAVRKETAWLRQLLVAGGGLLVGGVVVAYWLGHRESRTQINELVAMLTQAESSAAQLQQRIGRSGDTSYINSLRRENEQLAARLRATGPNASAQELESIKNDLLRNRVMQQGLAGMDLSAISARNDAGIAFLVTEIDGKPYGATAFGITPSGLLATNRHNVVSERGHAATRVGVKFANTDNLMRAHVVKVSSDTSVDLALVQIDAAGEYPVVYGVARSTDDLRAGAPVVTIGFPHALDLPMDGDKVQTTLTAGTVSKVLPTLLQLDAYAAHGSSGSPIFDASGVVVGVVFGGPKEAQGRLAYAVPSAKLAALLPADAQSILR